MMGGTVMPPSSKTSPPAPPQTARKKPELLLLSSFPQLSLQFPFFARNTLSIRAHYSTPTHVANPILIGKHIVKRQSCIEMALKDQSRGSLETFRVIKLLGGLCCNDRPCIGGRVTMKNELMKPPWAYRTYF